MPSSAQPIPTRPDSLRSFAAEPVRYTARVLCAEGMTVKARGEVEFAFSGGDSGAPWGHSVRVECRTAILNFSGEASVRERSGMFEVRLETPEMRLTLLSLLRDKLTEPPHSMVGTVDLHGPSTDGFDRGRYVIACVLPASGPPVP